MNIQNCSLTDKLLNLPSDKILSIIDRTYDKYFSVLLAKSKALQSDSPDSSDSNSLSGSPLDSSHMPKPKESKSPKLSNLILRLSNFAAIIKGNRAMKSGDIGRLMYM
jgi:hypothetical protein